MDGRVGVVVWSLPCNYAVLGSILSYAFLRLLFFQLWIEDKLSSVKNFKSWTSRML